MKTYTGFILTLLFLVSHQVGYSAEFIIDTGSDQKKYTRNQLNLSDLPSDVKHHALIQPNITALLDTAQQGEGSTIQFTVQGKSESLIFKKMEVPESGDVVHWIGVVEGKKNSRVRFTISKSSLIKRAVDGPLDNLISGVIVSESNTIELRPIGDDDTHLVMEYAGKSPRSLLRLTASSISEKRARWIEAKGKQRDLLEKINIRDYKIGVDGSLTVIKNLSALGLNNITVNGELDIQPVIKALAKLFPLIGSETFLFSSQQETTNHVIYEFSQDINGIRVYGHTLKFIVNKADSTLFQVGASVAVDRGYSSEPVLSSNEALQLALQFMNEEYGDKGLAFRTNLSDPRLIYNLKPKIAEGVKDLQLYWGIHVSNDYGSQFILVNSVDGSIRLLQQELHGQVRMCSASGDPTVKKCNPPPLIIDSSGACLSTPAVCADPAITVPYNTATDNITMWEDLIAPNCCNTGVNGTQDIVTDAPLPPGADAVYETQANPFSGGYVTAVMKHNPSIGFPEDPDLTAHEMGHAIHAHRNKNMYAGKGHSGTLSANRQDRALKEGIADINAIIYENYKHSPPFSNPNWETSGRILSNAKKYPDDFSAGQSEHENGRIASHAFYRLVVNSNNVDFRTAAETFYEAIPLILDDDNNAAISFFEFREAMIRAAGTDQNLIDAIEEAWSQVGIGEFGGSGGGTGGGGSSSSVNAPSFVNGSLVNACVDSDRTIYNLNWASVGNATQYDIFYLYLGIYLYSFSDLNTSEEVYTRINTNVKVKACNSTGCSALSTDSFAANFLCQ